jgi:hypothetical protein
MAFVENIKGFFGDFSDLAFWLPADYVIPSWSWDSAAFSLDSSSRRLDGSILESALVILDQPDGNILKGRVKSRKYKITFDSTLFVGLASDDTIFIAPYTYTVLEVNSLGDGALYAADLERDL